MRKIKNGNISETVRDSAILSKCWTLEIVCTFIACKKYLGGTTITCGSPVSSRPWPIFVHLLVVLLANVS